MSLRRFNPFASNASINSPRGSTRSTRPPTYTSNTTAAPTYQTNELATTSAHDPNERVRAWSASLPSASSVAPTDSDTLFNEVESSLTDTTSIGESSAEVTRPAGPRYVYYRVYAEDGAISSKKPISPDNRYLGRVAATLVPPPHTVASLKLCLSKIEKIDDKISTSLFNTISSQTSMDDTSRVSILAYPGPGCTPDEPIVLVAKFSGGGRSALRAKKLRLSSQERATSLETRYVYYRIYTEDGAILSANPVYSDNLYLGRIPAEFVTPPHTAASLRHCLSNAEKFDDEISTTLFIAASSQKPMDETGHLSILANAGPGSSPKKPVALVVKSPGVGKRSLGTIAIFRSGGKSPFVKQYLYYRIYKAHAAIPPKRPVGSGDLFVGRISIDCIPPPHTAASILRCMSKAEELPNSRKSQLFTSISSESPIGDAHVSMLAGDRPGSTPDDPLAFLVSKFAGQIRVTHQHPCGNYDPLWLTCTVGEILDITHEEPRNQPFIRDGATYQFPAHEAVNDAGKVGFVMAELVTPC